MSSSASALPLRRNGKPQACEPCRKAKAACDHALPHCGRCVRRGIASNCIYHPAPATKARNVGDEASMRSSKTIETYPTQRPAGTPTSNRSISQPIEVEGLDSAGRISDQTLYAHHCRKLQAYVESSMQGFSITTSREAQRSSGTPTNLRTISQQAEICTCDSGGSPAEFLGPTSYSSVFQTSVGEDLWNSHEGEPKVRGSTASRDDYDRQQGIQNAAERQRLGIEILKYFPERRVGERFYNRQSPIADVELHVPSIKYFHESIWSTYEKFLFEPRDPEVLAVMATRLLSNQHMPLPTFNTTLEWLNCFTGAELRWETVGIIFAVSGVSAIVYTDWDPPLAFSGKDGLTERREYAEKMIECAEQCLVLCDDSGVVNEFVIWLMHSIQSLQLMLSGGANRQYWRKHASLISALTALGLHRGADGVGSSTPRSFLASELRKRVFSAAFFKDKHIATFTGRPPVLSRRYIIYELPIDLSDEQLMLEGDDLSQALDQIGPDGWNSKEEVSTATYFRAEMLMSIIRDEILELSLGPPSEYSALRRDEVKQRSEQTYARLPAKLQCCGNELPSFDNPCSLVVTSINLSLGFLLNKLLLERLPDANGHQNREELFHTAERMLDRINAFFTNRDRLMGYWGGFVWAVGHFGIPSAGVLSVELFKQFRFPNQYRFSFSRSSVIQSLSVFVGCLSSISSSEEHYILCVRMRRVISRVLDQILEQPPAESIPIVEPGMSDFDLSDPELMEWLNTADWMKGAWMDPYSEMRF